jgi:hypothetical protein
VATLQPAAAVFREEQYFDWRVYALIASLVLSTGLGLLWSTDHLSWQAIPDLLRSAQIALGGLLGLAAPVFLVVMLLHMTTEVTPTDLRVWFGWIPVYRRVVAVDEIRRIEVVSYRPIAEYGGWGIRSGPDGERVLTARGNRGVRLELVDGSRLLIGSQRPEALATALERASSSQV